MVALEGERGANLPRLGLTSSAWRNTVAGLVVRPAIRPETSLGDCGGNSLWGRRHVRERWFPRYRDKPRSRNPEAHAYSSRDYATQTVWIVRCSRKRLGMARREGFAESEGFEGRRLQHPISTRQNVRTNRRTPACPAKRAPTAQDSAACPSSSAKCDDL